MSISRIRCSIGVRWILSFLPFPCAICRLDLLLLACRRDRARHKCAVRVTGRHTRAPPPNPVPVPAKHCLHCVRHCNWAITRLGDCALLALLDLLEPGCTAGLLHGRSTRGEMGKNPILRERKVAFDETVFMLVGLMLVAVLGVQIHHPASAAFPGHLNAP